MPLDAATEERLRALYDSLPDETFGYLTWEQIVESPDPEALMRGYIDAGRMAAPPPAEPG